MVSLPTYDNNLFARGHQRRGLSASSLANTDKPLLNHAVQRPVPARLDLQARRPGPARSRTARSRPDTRDPTTAVPDARAAPSSTSGTTAASGPCNIDCGFGHSSDTFFFQLAGMLGIDRLGYWAKQYGFGAPTGIDLPGEVTGIVPTNDWKMDAFGQPIFPGEDYQAGHRPGLRRRDADPAHQRLRRAGERRQALPAAARPRGRSARTATVVRPFKPEAHPQARRRRRAC